MKFSAGWNWRSWGGLARDLSHGVRAGLAAVAVILLVGVAPGLAHAAEGPYALRKVELTAVGGVFAGAAPKRSYWFYASTKIANAHSYNMIVYALHDNGETVEQFAARSGWSKVAEDNGFVVVYPEALNKTWFSGNIEEGYLKLLFDSIPANLSFPGPNPQRFLTYNSYHYITGDGVGGAVAQAFAIANPGLFAGVATLNGTAYRADLAKGDQPAQGYFVNQRGDKSLVPQWRPARKEIPVAAWLLTTGAPDARQTVLANYWKRADGVGAAAASNQVIGGLQTAVYTNAANPAQQVRTTVLPAGAKYDEALASTIWTQFFRRVARATDSPNGTLMSMMTQDEVNRMFEVRTTQVGDRTYKYYVKTPSSYRKGQPMPLVLAAHGFSYPPWMYLQQIKMHEVGEKEGFITIYLNGFNNAWTPTTADSPDLKYVNQVIAEAEANYSVDPTRIYMLGFSVGGSLTRAAGMTNPRAFAAVSPTSGIMPELTADIKSQVAKAKVPGDIRLPMLVIVGTTDGGSSDGKIEAKSPLANEINYLKAYNNVAAPDRVERFDSDFVAPYDIVVLGGKVTKTGVDAHYPAGRFERHDYLSADPKPLPLFSWIWVSDMMHGGDARENQMIWDYFKQWRRNPDGSLTYLPAH
ncbi:MAG TPA: PHB depolymerase family esterase [Caulobacteraceae bacterium]|jgi:poly(3-hydroxybutyrate) depolymerase|nr:PHB depolymerase family esterase [Caulobacteraceae bacterium]